MVRTLWVLGAIAIALLVAERLPAQNPRQPSRRNLEIQVKQAIFRELGRTVKDVQVQVENGPRGPLVVQAKVFSSEAETSLRTFLYSAPELAGYRIRLELERAWDHDDD